jgi:lysylphosphatidylglycerol synthetase-like protein (DUF2156 family)
MSIATPKPHGRELSRKPGFWIGGLLAAVCAVELLGAAVGLWHPAGPLQKAFFAAGMLAGLVMLVTLLATTPAGPKRLSVAAAVVLTIAGIALFAGIPVSVP